MTDLISVSPALGTMIFGRRLGCVSPLNPSTDSTESSDVRDIHEFVHCMRQLFEESSKMTVIPAKLAYRLNLPVWQRFVTAAETALSLGKNSSRVTKQTGMTLHTGSLARGYVEDNVQQMLTSSPAHNRCPFHSNDRSKQQVMPSSGVLDILTNKEKIETDEVVNIITDLFLAAADTVSRTVGGEHALTFLPLIPWVQTSHATQWALYLLARNPECQEKMLEEVNRVLEKDGCESVREEHLPHMPYVKGVIKECLRLYPVAPFLSRVLDKEITLNGFRVPAGVSSHA